MKTVIYSKVKNLAGMADIYDYLINHPNCVEELATLDYLIPLKTTLIFRGNRVNVIGSIFDTDSQTLKILIR